MLDAYASELNSIFNGIYDSIQRLEEQLLSQSGQQLSISELHIIETVWRYRSSGCSISDIAQEHQVTLCLLYTSPSVRPEPEARPVPGDHLRTGMGRGIPVRKQNGRSACAAAAQKGRLGKPFAVRQQSRIPP